MNVLLVPLLSAALLADAAIPWHLDGWQERAVVEITEPAAEAGVDTAAVRILLQGRAQADGRDIRVLDVQGKPVPFQLTWHDPARTALVAFRAADARAGSRYFVYYGNPGADRAPEQIVTPTVPGAGPPQGDWLPRAGLVYATIARPHPPEGSKKDDNPETEEELASLIAASPGRYGARYQRQISDGYNPFGSSDYYISLYRGWINIPEAGAYQFCTASNEASFSFLDGKPLVHWPGRHTEERGLRGEKNALVNLTAGLHYIEYYHEEVTLQQVAFLGWRPSGDPGEFSAIPESVFTRPHAAEVQAYSTPRGPALHFEPQVVDSIWPIERHEGQYTRVRFRVPPSSSDAAGATYHWSFGDGQSATGREVEHVYLTLGPRDVKLSIEGGAGGEAAWPLEVYEIQHATEQIQDGKPAEYLPIVLAYDRKLLDAAALKELAHLFADGGDLAASRTAASEYVQRFGAAHPAEASRMQRLIAECALRLGSDGVPEAIAAYQASITDQTTPTEKLDVLARLIRLLGIERDLPAEAARVADQIEATVKEATLSDESRAAYWRCLIATGDVLLWHGERDKSHEIYKRCEILSGQFIPAQVRAARLGSYPNSIREYLSEGNHGAALDLVNRWEETFPTDKINGHSFFWRGKLLNLRGDHKAASRYLARSIGLATGASFESESRWLLAQSLEKTGNNDAAQRELARLIRSGSADRYVEMARAKLKATVPDKGGKRSD